MNLLKKCSVLDTLLSEGEKTMAEVHLLIGTNLGDRQRNLQTARDYINQHIGVIRGVSQVYITQPWGFESNDIFFNQAVLLDTKYTPDELLKKIQFIENLMGRQRDSNGRYTSRIIDIDIIFYDNLVINNGPELVIPHPRMTERRFVLEPMSQLAPDKIHPLRNKTSRELLTECDDQNFVIRL